MVVPVAVAAVSARDRLRRGSSLLLSQRVRHLVSVRAGRARGNAASRVGGHFAWRRFIKIVPSYVLSIAVAYAIGYAQLQPNASLVPDLVTHLLFIHTWFPLRYGTIDGVLWTLAVEVEFYCIFPLIWWCFRRQPWLTAAVMVALAWYWRLALSTCCFTTLFSQYEENLPGYLDIFAFGMIAAYLFVRCGDRLRASRLRYAGPFVAVAGVAFFAMLLENLYAQRLHDQWAGVWQINNRPLLGAAFAIIALGWLFSPRWWQAVLDNAPLRFMAAISYNLYLYHQLVARELVWHHIPPYAGVPHENSKWQIRLHRGRFRDYDRASGPGDLLLRAAPAAAKGPATRKRC